MMAVTKCNVVSLIATVSLILCSFTVPKGVYAQQDAQSESKSQRERIFQEYMYPENYDPMFSRIAPNTEVDPNTHKYVITAERLEQIREPLLYPFYDGGADEEADEYWDENDYQEHLNSGTTMLDKKLNFLLPFFGFSFNYTWISINGYIGFSDHLRTVHGYPLHFPTETWPVDNDPSFIGPFFSECRIGKLRGDERDRRKPGVYYRVERDLRARKDQFGVELYERIKWDVREGIIGAEIFDPKHAFIVTWKNVTFNGGQQPIAQYVTNTFQVIVTTDEVMTFAIFNYEHLGWTTHTGAGGSTDDGQGGTPAFVGFNAGNGTRAFNYLPYSQSMTIRDLPGYGSANGKPGRHIFRIDEKIYPGACNPDPQNTNLPLFFAPESGNMLGGTVVNVTGPCFTPRQRVTCRFDAWEVEGVVRDQNRATCITPTGMKTAGYVDFMISQDGGPFYWKGKFFIETPMTSPEGVWFSDMDYQLAEPERLRIQWDRKNLTYNEQATVQISLWGYKEDRIEPNLIWIDMIRDSERNIGELDILPIDFINRKNPDMLDITVGLLQINLTQPLGTVGLEQTPILWSRPIPLGWYFAPQWREEHGKDWPAALCDNWIDYDREMKLFAYQVPKCPCLMEQAVASKAYYVPDFSCDKDGNTQCYFHQGAQHCVRTGMANRDAAGQQCCYDRDGYLMMSTDNKWGGSPQRAHNQGMMPYIEANKVPSLSHWALDVAPFYMCCMWQDEQSDGCETYRFERRMSQDCVGFQPPGAAAVFGDPHFYTYDGVEYTFNGRGEYVLVRADTPKHKLDVQGRFELVDPNLIKVSRATMLTSVAAKDNTSATVEVRLRSVEAQWRYKLDVIVDGRYYFFDRYPQKIQEFTGVTVYTPSNILNQSHVVVLFQSGASVEVVENRGFITGRVYLPLSFINQTRGLFGNWSMDPTDDFQLPDHGPDDYLELNTARFDDIHNLFGKFWHVEDKEIDKVGRTLFFHENGRSSNFYYDEKFEPEFALTPELPGNITLTPLEVARFCGESYQCYYDYAVTHSREFAKWSKHYQDEYVNIRESGLRKVTSCGALPTPKNGRKSTFHFTVGTEVKFDCNPGYVLLGENRRWCFAIGEWNWPEEGEATCIPKDEYYAMQAGLTAGIVLAILIPVLLVFICFVCCYQRSRASEGRQYVYKPPPNEAPIFIEQVDSHKTQRRRRQSSSPSSGSSRRSYPKKPIVVDEVKLTRENPTSDSGKATSTSSSSDAGSRQEGPTRAGANGQGPRGTMKGIKMMDGVYYTGEPLGHGKNADFTDYDDNSETI